MNKDLYAFMDTYNDKDLNDGAWQEMLQQAVRDWNRMHGTRYDPHTVFMRYLNTKKTTRKRQ